MKPDYKSRFTGFRVCRRSAQSQLSGVYPPRRFAGFEAYQQIPRGYENNLGPLTSLLINSTATPIVDSAQWQTKRQELKAKWTQLLGVPSTQLRESKIRLLETHQEENYLGKLMELQVGPDT